MRSSLSTHSFCKPKIITSLRTHTAENWDAEKCQIYTLKTEDGEIVIEVNTQPNCCEKLTFDWFGPVANMEGGKLIKIARINVSDIPPRLASKCAKFADTGETLDDIECQFLFIGFHFKDINDELISAVFWIRNSNPNYAHQVFLSIVTEIPEHTEHHYKSFV